MSSPLDEGGRRRPQMRLVPLDVRTSFLRRNPSLVERLLTIRLIGKGDWSTGTSKRGRVLRSLGKMVVEGNLGGRRFWPTGGNTGLGRPLEILLFHVHLKLSMQVRGRMVSGVLLGKEKWMRRVGVVVISDGSFSSFTLKLLLYCMNPNLVTLLLYEDLDTGNSTGFRKWYTWGRGVFTPSRLS